MAHAVPVINLTFMIITLEQAKKQLNIDPGFTDDDTYITELIGTVEIIIENDINRTMEEVVLLYDSVKSMKALTHAAKILLATYYANREATIVGVRMEKTPLSYDHIINAYRNYTIG